MLLLGHSFTRPSVSGPGVVGSSPASTRELGSNPGSLEPRTQFEGLVGGQGGNRRSFSGRAQREGLERKFSLFGEQGSLSPHLSSASKLLLQGNKWVFK